MVYLQHLISNPKVHVFNWPRSVSVSNEFKKIKTNIYYVPSPTVEDSKPIYSYDNLCCSYQIRASELVLKKQYTTDFAVYMSDTLLDYYLITNSHYPGIVVGETTINNNNILMETGLLSGCTACSLYLPDEYKIYLFHVGKNRDSKCEYSQKEKNAELLNVIAKKLNISIVECREKMDHELIANLFFMIDQMKTRAYINIFISKQSAKDSALWSDDTPKTFQNAKCKVMLDYYDGNADFLISLCKEQQDLFSVHYIKQFNTSDKVIKPLHTLYRDNIISR